MFNLFLRSLLKCVCDFINGLFLGIGGVLYDIVDLAYAFFMGLAKTHFFDASEFNALTNRLYIVVGVVAVFAMAYNIITIVIDPEKDTGGKTTGKILKDIIITFLIILICPFLFTLAYGLQDAIIDSNIFFKVINGSSSGSTNDQGNLMAWTVFESYFEDGEKPGTYRYQDDYCTNPNRSGTCHLVGSREISSPQEGFRVWAKKLNEAVTDNKIDYNGLLAIICGCFLVYLIVVYCFDASVRIFQLVFYQVIAPICICCRIIPQGEKIFKNWLNGLWKVYASVFIRIFSLSLITYLFNSMYDSDIFNMVLKNSGFSSSNLLARAVCTTFVILGLFMFLNKAVSMINETFGLDINTSIKDRISDVKGGFGKVMAGAAVAKGAGAGALALGGGLVRKGAAIVKNAHNAYKNARDKGKGKGKGVLAGFGAGLNGFATGGLTRSVMEAYKNGSQARGLGGMLSAAGSATDIAQQAAETGLTGNLANFGRGIASGAATFVGGGGAKIAKYNEAVSQLKASDDASNAAADKVLSKCGSDIDVDSLGNGKFSELVNLYWDKTLNGDSNVVGNPVIEEILSAAKNNSSVADMSNLLSICSDPEYLNKNCANATEMAEAQTFLQQMQQAFTDDSRNYVRTLNGDKIDLGVDLKDNIFDGITAGLSDDFKSLLDTNQLNFADCSKFTSDLTTAINNVGEKIRTATDDSTRKQLQALQSNLKMVKSAAGVKETINERCQNEVSTISAEKSKAQEVARSIDSTININVSTDIHDVAKSLEKTANELTAKYAGHTGGKPNGGGK